MKKIAYLFAVIACSILSLSAIASNTVPVDQNDQFVQSEMTKFMQQHDVYGAVVELYIDGKPHSYQFGQAYSTNQIRVDQETAFRIGTLTNLFTCLLLAQEIDQAKISLDDSVRLYLRSLSADFDEVSLQDLATQTGGLPPQIEASYVETSDLNVYLPHAKLEYAIGADWVFSDVGMGLLGAALSSAAKQPLSKLYEKQILRYLGMQSTVLTMDMQQSMHAAEGHDQEGNPIRRTAQNSLFSTDGFSTNAGDIRQFLGAAIGLPGTPVSILYPMRLTQSVFVRLPDRLQGLGWMIHELKEQSIPALLHAEEKMNVGPIEVEQTYLRPRYSGDMLLDQIGIADGFRSYIAVIPNRQAGIAIMTNKVVTHADIVNLGRSILFRVSKVTTPESSQEKKSEGLKK